MSVVIKGWSALVLFLFLLIGCSPRVSEMIVLEVGTTKVMLNEYETFFAKNSGGWDVVQQSSIEERERFLDLLTNYKLKLQDAHDRNLLNDSDIVHELREYRSSLASTFMLEKELTEPGIQQLYERKKEEIRVQHILLSVKPDAPPEDTLTAYQKAMGIIQRVKSGEKFDTLVTRYSEDPGGKTNNGDIYYFTAGQMVAQFENAAYSMRRGEISSVPTRTPFGYHIIKITDRKPVQGSIKVRHIMSRFQSTSPDSADTARAFKHIHEVRDSLKKGWDFAKLATKLSEDAGSSEQGGDLGWFERRQWVQQFDEAAFKLQASETSDIVRTPYGYHILKCDSVKPVPPFSVVREDLKKLYQQHRYSEDYKTAIEQIKKIVGYSFYDDTFTLFLSHLDSVKGTEDKNWYLQVPAVVRALPLLTINNNNFSIDTILTILDRKADSRTATSGKKDIKNRIERLTESLLLETKAIDLEKRSPEFAALMKEYEDGIVLFKAEQLEVWNKTVVSDSALRAFYTQNRSKFMFPDRVNTSVIIVDSDTLAFMIYDSLKQGGNFSEFAARYSDDPDLKSKNGVRESQPVDTDELTQQAALLSVNEFSEPIELEEGGYGIVKLLLKEPAREKSFEEAGAEVSNSYQEYQSKFLEKQWLEKIQQKHPVKQYKEVLQKAFSSQRVAH